MQHVFHVITNGENYPEFATTAQENKAFNNQVEGGANESVTWLIWLRRYGLAGDGMDNAVTAPHTNYR